MKTQSKETSVYVKASPEFNADTAYSFVQKQVDFGPRVVSSAAHIACGDWIVKSFKKYAHTVIEQKGSMMNWDKRQIPIRNIIASFNPKHTKRILITAHWDSRPYADNDPVVANHRQAVTAADDGASGVAVMLEMARVLAQKMPDVGVDFICFDAEDLGKTAYDDSYCLGSQYWGRNLHQAGYKADFAINLDMVGGRGAKFVWEGYSIQQAEPVLRRVWDHAIQLGYSGYFFYFRSGAITDDHKYIFDYTSIPAIDIICFNQETGFPSWWHTIHDTMENIDRNTLKAVGQTVLETIFKY
ncbi:MAG: M28 family peptidase [Bacteroidia bacterium]